MIGKGNIQNVSDIGKLMMAVDQAEATLTEKAEAKSLWEKVSNNKLLLGIFAKFGLIIH